MRTYDSSQVQELMDLYHSRDLDVEVLEIEEGTLGWGLTVIRAEGLKTAVVTERYLNEWASTHSIRMYNKTPKKYEDLIEKHYRESEMN